ncbi:MAG: CbtA family protein [Chloroflexi bacterium]|nr:CbtA family protein [Chloroflexota bacterium]
MIAGLAAGLTVAIFHAIVTEPVIDRAIALEEQQHQASGTHEEPVVNRGVQKIGLVVGYVIYGLTFGVLFASAYALARRWLPGAESPRTRLLAALAAYWAVGLLPFLKYPANPPGVGDPETIGTRQELYLGFLILSVIAVVLAIALSSRLTHRLRSMPARYLAVLVAAGLLSALLYLTVPGTQDKIEMPEDLVGTFRWLSLAGVTLFWTVLGLFFGFLPRSSGSPAAQAPRQAY